MAGEHGSFATPQPRRQPAAACADSRHAETRDAGHMVVLERTAEVADLATRFPAGTPPHRLPYCRSVERIPPALAAAAGPPAPTRRR